ncbi:DUF5133 domain-containing protein [Streptomyces sp. NPDC058284]|uniref:DUF5133 domain-containing protein n=1 Tax=unclassified Streptomyces TaxID=2593676 RepID=UPI00364766C4
MVLLPAKDAVARHLSQYRSWERQLFIHPADRDVRAQFESSAYTLCVLMGECTARVAAEAAEEYLRPRAACRPRPAPEHLGQ